MGQSWIFAKRKPVASTMNPPQALKSLTIEGMVSGKISFAQKKSTRKIVACGIATGDTVASGEQGKDHRREKISSMDLAIRMLWSPRMPETIAP
jgi:hypothetical protein